jgi:hypothetical protein
MGKLNAKKYGERSGGVHLTSNVNNFVVLTEQRLKELQEARRQVLAS